ncbi:MAG: hypothetical protein IJM75_00925 [Ruminococcus sp.]|nr:hypothetical protein [Ruminococcus sp.]
MEENKKLFVEKLGSLIKRQTRAGQSIKEIRYETFLAAERVVIVFYSDYTKVVDITADSCLAIMHDIYKALS